MNVVLIVISTLPKGNNFAMWESITFRCGMRQKEGSRVFLMDTHNLGVLLSCEGISGMHFLDRNVSQ